MSRAHATIRRSTDLNSGVAQSAERAPVKRLVASSSLAPGAIGLLLFLVAVLATAGCPRPDSPVPVDVAPTGSDPISRATRYLSESNPADDASVSLILDYLRRRFALGGLSTQVAYGEELSRDTGNQLHLYRRIFDPNAKLGNYPTPADAGIDPSQMAPVAYLPLIALHCDRWPLPADFDFALQAEVSKGGYFTTHALLALQWAREQGCATGSPELVVSLRAGLVDIAQRQGADDLFAESLAMLYYGGFGDAVQPDWIATLRRSQRSDGSFPFGGSETNPRHSTSLALWALCGADRLGDPKVTWIPDPGPPAPR